MLTLGSVIQNKRIEKKLSVKEVSSKAGITAGYLRRIEAAERIPTIDVLRQIAFQLNISFGCLIVLSEIELGVINNNIVASEDMILVDHIKNSVNLVNYLLGYNRK